MIDGLKITVLAESLRAHWQLGSMDDWFCSSCGRSHGCDTSVEVMACDDDDMPLQGVRSKVICGECFDDRKIQLAETTASLPYGVHAFVLDGRLIDWGCPPMSPPEAFQPLSALLQAAPMDMFSEEVGQ